MSHHVELYQAQGRTKIPYSLADGRPHKKSERKGQDLTPRLINEILGLFVSRAVYLSNKTAVIGLADCAPVRGRRGEIDSPEKIRQRVERGLYCKNNQPPLLDVWILFLAVMSRKAYRCAI